MANITSYRHPQYSANSTNWKKWRSVYEGGECFIDQYLEKFSSREDITDFNRRKCFTPTPSFAKAAVNDIKNSIFQRMSDITRRDGSPTYQAAVIGNDNGVDLHGASMNSFMGLTCLPELLSMGRVGVYVDMPANPGNTLIESAGKRPYVYMYRTEQICSWSYRPDKVDEFGSLLLVDYLDDCCPKTHLPNGTWERYRHVFIAEDGKVHVQYYNSDADMIDQDGGPNLGEYILDIDYIPFTILELSDSLLSDVANHQVALLNLESSDIAYALLANVGFYVEQRDARINSEHLKKALPGATGETGAAKGENEIKVGAMQGRSYAIGTERPGFINPSSEPLKASMEKQKALKDDIRQLVNLALSNVTPKMASAESKVIDERGLEAGLSYIGLILEHAERKIALYWSAYERVNELPTIHYPEKYSLVSDEDRRQAVEQLEKLRDSIPSETLSKAVSKQMAQMLMGNKIPVDVLDKIYTEIDNAPSYSADPTILAEMLTAGVASKRLAEKILGYPVGTVEDAEKEHVDRLAAIAEAQAKAKPDNPDARGVPDQSGTPGAGAKEEKQDAKDQTQSATPKSSERGEGK